MKIAICFSGQIRTGVINSVNIKHFLGNLSSNCDFFAFTWDIETYTNLKYANKLVVDKGIDANQPYTIDSKVISDFYDIYKPKSMVVNDYNQWYNNNMHVDPNMYCIRKSYELVEFYRKNNNLNYDYIIITRPDCLFDKSKSLQEDINEIEDDRTFCYARLFDEVNNAEHLESVYWIGSQHTMDLVSKFQYVIENRHPSKNIDGYIHLGNWISTGLGLNVKRLRNSKTAIYRWQHYENNISPLDSWEKFQR